MLVVVVFLSIFGLILTSKPIPKCLPGSVPSIYAPDDSICYSFVDQQKTFVDAENHCKSLDGHLAVVDSVFTDMFLAKTAFENFSSPSTYWIGGRVSSYMSVDIWTWTRDDSLLRYTNWRNATAGRAPPPQSCTSVSSKDVYWNVADCGSTLPFVCQVPGYFTSCDPDYSYFPETGSCYKLFSFLQSGQGHTFNQSESICQADGGQLVSIHSSSENTFVSLLAPGRASNYSMYLWIGARADSNTVLTWTDGTPADYSNWDNYGTLANLCVVLWSDGDVNGQRKLQWYGLCSCSGNRFGRFICKKPLQTTVFMPN